MGRAGHHIPDVTPHEKSAKVRIRGLERMAFGIRYAFLLVAESTLYTFSDTMIPYRTESAHFFGAYELSN